MTLSPALKYLISVGPKSTSSNIQSLSNICGLEIIVDMEQHKDAMAATAIKPFKVGRAYIGREDGLRLLRSPLPTATWTFSNASSS